LSSLFFPVRSITSATEYRVLVTTETISTPLWSNCYYYYYFLNKPVVTYHILWLLSQRWNWDIIFLIASKLSTENDLSRMYLPVYIYIYIYIYSRVMLPLCYITVYMCINHLPGFFSLSKHLFSIFSFIKNYTSPLTWILLSIFSD